MNKKMLNASGVFVVAFVALAAIVAWRGLSPKPKDVAVIGDSLVFQSSDKLNAGFQNQGTNGRVRGDIGYDIADQQNWLQAAVGYKVPVVVVALGTNDARHANEGGGDELLVQHQKIMYDAWTSWREGCWVWVDVNSHSHNPEFNVWADKTNALMYGLAEQENRNGSTIKVVKWNEASAGQDNWFEADGVHLTDEGQQAYADVIIGGANSCR